MQLAPFTFTKRQGVSGESSDQHGAPHHQRLNNKHHSADLLITSHDKDFRYSHSSLLFFLSWPLKEEERNPGARKGLVNKETHLFTLI